MDIVCITQQTRMYNVIRCGHLPVNPSKAGVRPTERRKGKNNLYSVNLTDTFCNTGKIQALQLLWKNDGEPST